MTLLSEDLADLVKFDSKQTLPALDMNSSEYDEGMSLYLKQLGVAKIDEQYNEQVKAFETQLEETELSAKLNASLLAEAQADAAVEASPGLGTGAAAIASEGRQKALGAANAEIERGIAEAYQSGIQSIGEEYQAALESVLGEYDAATGTFSGLNNYEAMANESTVAIAKVIALMIDPNVDTYNADSYMKVLTDAGYIEAVAANGEVVMTAAGQQMVDALLNGVNVNSPQASLGGKTLQYAIAEQMAKSQYSGEEHWDLLSDSKREELITQYASWLHNNENALRLTEWDLYEPAGDGYILDTEHSADTVNIENVNSESGIPVISLSLSDVSDCTQDEFGKIKAKLISGEISDGSYFTFQSGKAGDDDKFYYIEDGVVYKTEYTMTNPPAVINARQATIYSFGKFQDTGKGKFKQDEWVKEIIDSANAGRIPDGTYINFNYGASADGMKSGWYKYENGMFKRVSGDERITVTDDYGRSLETWLKDSVHYTSNNIYNRGWGQKRSGLKYLDW
jgi:hypothetical protein